MIILATNEINWKEERKGRKKEKVEKEGIERGHQSMRGESYTCVESRH